MNASVGRQVQSPLALCDRSRERSAETGSQELRDFGQALLGSHQVGRQSVGAGKAAIEIWIPKLVCAPTPPLAAIRPRSGAIRPNRACARASPAPCRDRCPARGRCPRANAPRRAGAGASPAACGRPWSGRRSSRTACRSARGRARARTRWRIRRSAEIWIALDGAGELQPEGADQASGTSQRPNRSRLCSQSRCGEAR